MPQTKLIIEFDILYKGRVKNTLNKIIEVPENKEINELMNLIKFVEAPYWLEQWCNINDVDYYEDEGYSLDNIMIKVRYGNC